MAVNTKSDAALIIENVGGATNIAHLTHCATRLRFEVHDGSLIDQAALDKIDTVLGVVPQGANRVQVVIGGGVEDVYSQIMHLPEMSSLANKTQSNDDVKAALRSGGPRGKVAWIDAFFEYLSDSFRPILGILLGASLIIASAAVLDALNVVNFRAADKAAGWVFIDSMWHSVFFFLPLMVAYNASKKLKVDPWLGAAIMGALMTPEFTSLSNPERFPNTVCITDEVLKTKECAANIFGISMPLNSYSGNVFVPLMMAAILALVYRTLKKIFPENVQMVFVPFFSIIIMVPITAMILGPFGIFLGNSIGSGLAWLNSNAPILFAILIPLLYPFLVPLGLHWPLNALMIINIDTLGYDFIQGPMGSWNFACFGATAGVLYLSMREKDTEMRQTATGALAAGLFGGISEPSLYGIHLRFKRIYPRMLVGCFVGGLITGLFGGVRTSAFAFTSLLTIPVFSPMALYAISIAAAFFTAMILIIISGYKDKEPVVTKEETPALEKTTPVEKIEPTTTIAAVVAGKAISLDEVKDPVFTSRALGEGVGIIPAESVILAPVTGVLKTVHTSGHAFGLKTDDGVEVLIHIGIDTVKLNGEHFTVKVNKGDYVTVGTPLVKVDFPAVEAAGYDTTIMLTVSNTRNLKNVIGLPSERVAAGDKVIDVDPSAK